MFSVRSVRQATRARPECNRRSTSGRVHLRVRVAADCLTGHLCFVAHLAPPAFSPSLGHRVCSAQPAAPTQFLLLTARSPHAVCSRLPRPTLTVPSSDNADNWSVRKIQRSAIKDVNPFFPLLHSCPLIDASHYTAPWSEFEAGAIEYSYLIHVQLLLILRSNQSVFIRSTNSFQLFLEYKSSFSTGIHP